MQTQDIAKIIYDAEIGINQVFGLEPLPAFEEKKAGLLSIIDKIKDTDTPSELHSVWLKGKAAEGWGWGLILDEQRKQDPRFVEYDNLPLDLRIREEVIYRMTKSLKPFLDIPQAKLPDPPLSSIPNENLSSIGPVVENKPEQLTGEVKDLSTGAPPQTEQGEKKNVSADTINSENLKDEKSKKNSGGNSGKDKAKNAEALS